jgi:hypothetical protein
MAMYEKRFVKTVYGYFTVEADSMEEAQELFDSGDYDEYDNHSDYDTEEWELLG